MKSSRSARWASLRQLPPSLRALSSAPHAVAALLLAAWAAWLLAGRHVRRLNVDCHVGTALAGTAPACPAWLDRHYAARPEAEVEAALALRRGGGDGGGGGGGDGDSDGEGAGDDWEAAAAAAEAGSAFAASAASASGPNTASMIVSFSMGVIL